MNTVALGQRHDPDEMLSLQARKLRFLPYPTSVSLQLKSYCKLRVRESTVGEYTVIHRFAHSGKSARSYGKCGVKYGYEMDTVMDGVRQVGECTRKR